MLASRFKIIYYITGALGFAAVVISPEILTTIIRMLGGSTATVGFFVSAGSMMNLAGVVAAPVFLGLIGSRKRMIVRFSSLAAMGFAGVAISILVFQNGAAIVGIAVSVALYTFCMANVNMPFSDLLRRNLDDSTRIRTMGQVASLSLLTTAGAGLIIRSLLKNGLVFPQGYAGMILAGALVGLTTALVYSRLPAEDGMTAPPHSRKAAVWLRSYKEAVRGVLHNRKIAVLFANILFFATASSSAQLFISIGYDKSEETMKLIVATGIPLAMLIKSISYFFAGKLAARIGGKKVLILIGIASLGSPLAALLLPVQYFMIVFVCNQLIPMWYPFFLNETLRLSDDATFPGYYLIFSLLPLPVTLLLPGLGAIANANPTLFCILILASLLIGIGLLAWAERGKGSEQGF